MQLATRLSLPVKSRIKLESCFRWMVDWSFCLFVCLFQLFNKRSVTVDKTRNNSMSHETPKTCHLVNDVRMGRFEDLLPR